MGELLTTMPQPTVLRSATAPAAHNLYTEKTRHIQLMLVNKQPLGYIVPARADTDAQY